MVSRRSAKQTKPTRSPATTLVAVRDATRWHIEHSSKVERRVPDVKGAEVARTISMLTASRDCTLGLCEPLRVPEPG